MRLWISKASFLAVVNFPKCEVAVLLMVKGLFTDLVYFSVRVVFINQYAGLKTLADNFGASLLLLELSCFRNIVLRCLLRMVPHVFVRSQHFREIISLVFFSSVQFMKKSTFLNIKLRGGSPLFPLPNQLLVSYSK